MNWVWFFVILFGNAWIWRIYKLDLLLFVVLILFSISLQIKKKYFISISVFLLITTIFFQWQKTEFESFTLLSNDDQRVHDRRIQFYKPSLNYTRSLFHRFDVVNLLEGNIGTAYTRLNRNLFETLDPNVYFYGGFPRQRVEILDFEKFPFALIIPFLIGFYFFYKEKSKFIFIYFGLSLTLLILLGNKSSNFGPFLLLPFFVTLIYKGMQFLVKTNKLILVIFIMIFFLSLIQNITYAT